MVLSPAVISSMKPFMAPSLAERSRNRGRTRLARYRVTAMDRGMVTANTSTSRGVMDSIISNDPTTVTKLAAICTRSWVREVLMVSMS